MTSPRFFRKPAEFRAWLEQHHATVPELWVGFHKRHSATPSITWPESVDEVLCFGWIDGVRKSIDDERYMIRFTPRRAGSIWSNVNMAKVQRLIEAGRMHAAGLAAWSQREEARSGVYSFEQKPIGLDAAMEKEFRRHSRAWEFFQAQPPGYRRQMAHRVASAKRQETQARRLAVLIAASARGERLP